MRGGAKDTILIVEDDRFLREQLWWSLKGDYDVSQASDRDEAIEILRRARPDVVLLDLHLPPRGHSKDGMDLLGEIRRKDRDAAVIVMTADERKECALQAIERGAYDFFRKPVDLTELGLIVRRAVERVRIGRENRRLRARLRDQDSFREIIGGSKGLRRVLDAVRRVADSDAAVLIRGESGTGKELVARAIHNASPRRNGRFVPVQCSALPESLIESELFGHERGAFTGAVSAVEGHLAMARGGTLFLDEIGSVDPALQAKLLRVIERKQFHRLGSRQMVRVDFRLVTATNEDLESAIRDARFREDLYYRINVFPIWIPPLRERREDIPLLVDHFLELFCEAKGIPVKPMSPEALERLTRHHWRGNVRELENLIQSLVLTADGDRIEITDLPPHLLQVTAEETRRFFRCPGRGFDLTGEVDRFEAQLLRLALEKAGSVKTEAARLLGIDKNRMMYLCRKHNLRNDRAEG
ncbi:MAG: sigma-54-dependent transcriptional regulator [Acidobacteriota bacterium]